nr:uncharacterized protein LOC109169483 [Ipomoea batatas]
MQPYEEENTEDMKNKILARIEELKQEMANIREKLKQESRQRTSSLGQETQASIRTLEDQMAQLAKGGNEEEDTHDRSEGVENENVKEEVEDKKKTRNESVREEVEEKVRNDEKEKIDKWLKAKRMIKGNVLEEKQQGSLFISLVFCYFAFVLHF